MTSQLIAMLAAAGLVTAGVASSAETRSAASLPLPVIAGSAGGGQCLVKVIRSGPAGTADVFRNELPNGNCVCTIVTGPKPKNGVAENAVNTLLQSGECPSAPPGAAAAAQGAGGVSGTVLGVLVGTLGAGGLIVALSKKTPG